MMNRPLYLTVSIFLILFVQTFAISGFAGDRLPLLEFKFNNDSTTQPGSGTVSGDVTLSGAGVAGTEASGTSGITNDRAFDNSANAAMGWATGTPRNGVAESSVIDLPEMGEFTVCGWFKTETVISGSTILFQVGHSSGQRIIVKNEPSAQGTLQLSINGTISSRSTVNNTNYALTGQWVFFAITWDGSSVTYFDGTTQVAAEQLGSPVPLSSGPVNPTAGLCIGNTENAAANDLSTRPFDGSLDNLRMFNRVLTPSELEFIRAGDVDESLQKLVMLYFEPWQSINNNVVMSQRYYDMALAHATTDRQGNLTAEILEAADYGVNAIGTTIDVTSSWAYKSYFERMLIAAEGTGVKIYPQLVNMTDDTTRVQTFRSLLDAYGDHPNWLKVRGRPVWSTFWAANRGDQQMYLILRQLLPDAYMLGDPDNNWGAEISLLKFATYANCFDMFFSFSEVGRSSTQLPGDIFPVLSEAASLYAVDHSWMAPAAPGYLGAWISGRNDFYTPFRNMDYFLDCWDAIVQTSPNWALITSWNDKDETHIQPTLYQWESMIEISSYYIDKWRGRFDNNERPSEFYCAYTREQLLGCSQRIELLFLPGSLPPSHISASGELLNYAGLSIATLAQRTINSSTDNAVDWCVNTAEFTLPADVVVPVLYLTQDGLTTTHRLPAFVLRSGWIANQANVRIPLSRAGNQQASLQIVDQNDDHKLRAIINYSGGESVKSVELFRCDRRIATFDPAHQSENRLQLLLSSTSTPGWSRMTVDGTGEILRAMRGDNPESNMISWTDSYVSASYGWGSCVAVDLKASPSTVLTFTSGTNSAQLTVGDILEREDKIIMDNITAAVSLTGFHALADLTPDFSTASFPLELNISLDAHRSQDSYHVRIETESGKIIESQWVYPWLASDTTLDIDEVNTVVSMDVRAVSFYNCSTTPTSTSTQKINVRPGVMQISEWDFNNADHIGRDKAGRDHLVLGRGESFLGVDPDRVPAWLSSGGPDGSGCLEFDGVDDRAQMQIQQEPKGAFTISFDINPTGTPAATEYILSCVEPGSTSSANQLMITRLTDGRVKAEKRNHVAVYSVSVIPVNQWTSVKISFDGSFMRMYVNANLVDSASCSPDFRLFTNSRMYLGGVDKPLNGKLDNFRIEGGVATSGKIILNAAEISSYCTAQDVTASQWEISDDSFTLHMWGNNWKALNHEVKVSSGTILEFDFKCDSEGEIHSIGFDNQKLNLVATAQFQLHGTQLWANSTYDNLYTTGSGWRHYSIPVGQHIASGTYRYITFGNDDDAASLGDSYYRNIKVYTP